MNSAVKSIKLIKIKYRISLLQLLFCNHNFILMDSVVEKETFREKIISFLPLLNKYLFFIGLFRTTTSPA